MSDLRISLLSGERDNQPSGMALAWDEIPAKLGAREAPCTLETCGKGPYRKVRRWQNKKTGEWQERFVGCSCKYGAAWSPAVFPPGATRCTENVGVVSALVIDMDHLTDETLEAATDALEGYAYHAHPSHSDKPGDRCWRVVVRLSEPVLAADWPRFWRAALKFLGQTEPADPSCKNADRLYFVPCARADAEITGWHSNAGAPLAVRDILAIAEPREEIRKLGDQNDLPPATPALLERCRQRLRDHGPAIEGQGGDRWTFSACAALIHGFGLSEEEAWPLLLEWNETCEPPWDEDELLVKLTNAASYAAGPRGAARLEWEASAGLKDRLIAGRAERLAAEAKATADLEALYGEVDLDALADGPAPTAEPEPDAEDLPFDHDAALLAIAAAQRGETLALEREYMAGFPGAVQEAEDEIAAELGDEVSGALADLQPLFVHASEVIARPMPATPWLVRGVLKEGGVAMIGAGPKVGKTWTALELACTVATGGRAFGSDRFKAPRPRAVAYYFAEDDQAAVAAHLRAYASGRQIPVEDLVRNLYLCPMGQHIDLRRPRDLARVLASCRQIPSLALLVLDPFRDIHGAAENDSDEMARVLGGMRFLARKLEGTLLVPHHAKKLTREDLIGGAAMAGAALRGSSAIFGALDSTIMMALDEKNSDETHFVIDARAVIKGAKSAGLMSLKLTLVDDERDQAKHAEWSYKSGGEKKADEAIEEMGEAQAEDLAVSLVEHLALLEARKEPPRSVEKLRAELKWGSAKLSAAIAHASGQRWIEKPRMKWELSDAGRRMHKAASSNRE